jgi:hypothetical protein
MIPKIFEYNPDAGRVELTDACYLLPELKAIIDKYEDPIPYLTMAYYMAAPDSPYVNLTEQEKEDSIIADMTENFGVFEFESPLIKQAIRKLESLYETVTIRHYKSLMILIDKFSDYIRTNEIMEGKDGNMPELQRIWKEAGSNIRSYKDLEKQVEEELRAKTRGGHEIGDY